MQTIGDITTTANNAGEFIEGNAAVGVGPTLIKAAWLNTIQRELLSVLSGADISPDSGDDNQLVQAIRALAGAAADFQKLINVPTTLEGYGIAPATQDEAEAGLDDRKPITSLGVRQAITSPTQRFPDQVFRRNRIINGNFDIWQRGRTGIVGTDGVVMASFTADRWLVHPATGSIATWAAQSLPPGYSFNEARQILNVKFAGSVRGSSIRQRVECVETLAGKKATVSFYLRASIESVIEISLTQFFGFGGSPSADVVISKQISATRNFERYEVSFDIPVLDGKQKGFDADCLELAITTQSTIEQTLELVSVQLEEGCFATKYEIKSVSEELNACYRYFEKSFADPYPIQSNNGAITCIATAVQASAANTIHSALRIGFRATKRVKPSLVLYSPGEPSAEVYCQTMAKACKSTGLQSLFLDGFALSTIPPVGSAPGFTFQIEWTADAEL